MTSIRRNLLVRLLVGSVALLVVVDVALVLAIRARLLEEFDVSLVSRARMLASLVEYDGEEVDFERGFRAPEFEPGDDAEYFQVLLEDGGVLARSASLGDGDLPRSVDSDEDATLWDAPLPDGRRGRIIELVFAPRVDVVEEAGESDEDRPPLEVREEDAPVTVLLLARAREGLDALVARMFWLVGVFSLLYAVAVAALIRHTVGRALRPLDEIAAQVEAIDHESLDARVVLSRRVEELEPTVSSFNDMLDRVESGWERERRFSSDVAHELRTPLAELRNLSDVGAKWPGDEAMARKFFDDVRGITANMEKITAGLLTISRSENGTETIVPETVAVGDAVDSCWKAVVVNGVGGRGVTLDNRIAPDFTLDTDPVLFRVVLANVLENAGAYAEPGSAVVCMAEGGADAFRIQFSNPVAAGGLTPEDAEVMFDRFWRKDESRSGDGHSGLGLAVVRAVCDRLGYDVRGAVEPGGVFRLVVSGPADRRPD